MDKLLHTIGELMDVDIKMQIVTIKQVEFDKDRQDVASTIKRIIATLKTQSVQLKSKVKVGE